MNPDDPDKPEEPVPPPEEPSVEPPPPVEAAAEPEPEPIIEEPPVAEEPAFEDAVFEEQAEEPVYKEPVEAPRYEAPVEEPPRYEEPAYEEPVYEEPVAVEPRRPVYEDEAPPPRREPEPLFDESVFGEPEIPMPAGREKRIRAQQARDAQRNLDLDLGRIKRRKRYGIFLTTLTVLFIALVIAPVTWAAVYLFVDPPSTVLMLQRAAEGESIRHRPVALEHMSPHIVRAVIAAEDSNFCRHDGFDVEAIQKAMRSNERGGRTRGASTISQQTAKNLFLWPSRSWLRKGFETYFTALIEFMWPKRRIMEAYLNAAEWGDGIFGIEAAARARFGVSAEDLTPLQAARLAAVLPSPNRWRADSPGPYVRRRAATIVQRAQVVRNEHMADCVLALDRAPSR